MSKSLLTLSVNDRVEQHLTVDARDRAHLRAAGIGKAQDADEDRQARPIRSAEGGAIGAQLGVHRGLDPAKIFQQLVRDHCGFAAQRRLGDPFHHVQHRGRQAVGKAGPRQRIADGWGGRVTGAGRDDVGTSSASGSTAARGAPVSATAPPSTSNDSSNLNKADQ